MSISSILFIFLAVLNIHMNHVLLKSERKRPPIRGVIKLQNFQKMYGEVYISGPRDSSSFIFYTWIDPCIVSKSIKFHCKSSIGCRVISVLKSLGMTHSVM